MGFSVSTLHNIPIGSVRYFFHVIDLSNSEHSKWINENLQMLSKSFDRNAGLVTGPENLTIDLYNFLKKNIVSKSDFNSVEILLRRVTCIVISNGHISNTTKSVYILPLSFPEEDHEWKIIIETIIKMLSEAIKRNQLEKLLDDLGARKFGLSNAGGGLAICTLRNLNSFVELKPNINGIGLNINSMIEKLLPPPVREI